MQFDSQITKNDRYMVIQEAVEARKKLKLILKRNTLASMVAPIKSPQQGRMFPNQQGAHFHQRSRSINVGGEAPSAFHISQMTSDLLGTPSLGGQTVGMGGHLPDINR